MIGLRPSTSKVGLSFLPHLSPLLSRVYRNLFKYLLEVPIRTSCDTWLSSRKSWSTGSPWGRKFNVCYIWFFDPQSTVQRMILKKDKKDVMDGLGIFIFSYLDHRPFCTFFAEHWKQRTSLYLVKEDVWKVVWSDVRWCEMMWDDVRWCEMGRKEQVCGARALLVDFMDLIESLWCPEPVANVRNHSEWIINFMLVDTRFAWQVEHGAAFPFRRSSFGVCFWW